MNEKEESIQKFIKEQEDLFMSIKNNIVHLMNQQKKLFESIESLYEGSPLSNLLDTRIISEKLNAIMDDLMGFYCIDWEDDEENERIASIENKLHEFYEKKYEKK